jgi:electron-transferring-flavoprotein dehydrogenase
MTTERESIEVDVLFVGAGPACLSGAYHLAEILAKSKESGTDGPAGGELSIMVIEKGREVGAHGISGAVLNPRALDELIPDWKNLDPPFSGAPVSDDNLYFLTQTGKFKLPYLPPFLANHGNYVISLSRFVRWLAPIVEEKGVDVFPEFPAVELLYENGTVVGVRTGDKGISKDGEQKSNYEQGIDILAKVTVLGEGTRGTLTKGLVKKSGLDSGKSPQTYTLGVKEVWEVPAGVLKPGEIIHTMLWPLGKYDFGGGFVYCLEENLVAVGMVVGLGNRDPYMNTHEKLQEFKTHPLISDILKSGQIVEYGAKTIPEGGYYAIPRPYAPGVLLAGDSASFLNSRALKGIHLAMKSGMLAAETIFDALTKDDFSAEALQKYETLVEGSWIKEELYPVRNFHQGFDDGLYRGLIRTGFQMISGGKGLTDPMPSEPDFSRVEKVKDYYGSWREREVVKYDNTYTFDKLTNVYHSGTKHDEDQPAHLQIADFDICNNKCTKEYGNPCESFCPANVYEMEEEEGGGKHLKLNPTNCVHCKTCDVMDPYEIITWVPPEGGGGPNHQRT